MKTNVFLKACCCSAFLSLMLAGLSGCGDNAPVVPSAEKQIDAAEKTIKSAEEKAKKGNSEDAVKEYKDALDQIDKCLDIASGNEIETKRLGILKKDTIQKKIDAEAAARNKPIETPAKVKVAAATRAIDPKEAKRLDEKQKADDKAKADSELEAKMNASKKPKKVDEPEDTGEVANGKPKAPKAGAADDKTAENPDAPKAPPKDKNGIYADPSPNDPDLKVVKIVRTGKQVAAYCQYYNKSEDALRVSIYNYFKDRDNQNPIPPLQAPAFPYDHFNTKAKDLFEQSINNIMPDKEEVKPHEYLQFVSIGECANEETAGRVTKLFVEVRLSNGTKLEATGPEGANAPLPDMKFKAPK